MSDTTDQIDVENAERYHLKFTDRDNRQKTPIILHLSPSGSIERVMYALLEKAFLEQKAGKNPVFPLWLAPTQIRLNPLSDDYLSYCKIADEMEKENIRVDIDDRVESVGKKIRDSETEWINLIVVVGEKEMKSGKLAVRFRKNREVKSMTPKQIIQLIKSETEGFPFKQLPLPRNVSKRAVFYG